mmetsp:Transcript_80947/g.203674  ORF Transcript_80947/g.203674 Transcript_80947/m.203674 type:complete len:228 (+) Transcript_80947:102-785(+)
MSRNRYEGTGLLHVSLNSRTCTMLQGHKSGTVPFVSLETCLAIEGPSINGPKWPASQALCPEAPEKPDQPEDNDEFDAARRILCVGVSTAVASERLRPEFSESKDAKETERRIFCGSACDFTSISPAPLVPPDSMDAKDTVRRSFAENAGFGGARAESANAAAGGPAVTGSIGGAASEASTTPGIHPATGPLYNITRLPFGKRRRKRNAGTCWNNRGLAPLNATMTL